MEKLKRSDPDFYSKISRMRKVKSGGKYFKDKEAARQAQKKGVEARLRAVSKRPEEQA